MPAALAVVDRATALEFLFSRINYERTVHIPYSTGELKLERMQQLLALLGNPHLAVPAVHIAGTKGKGSTATMIARVLQAAGYRTGLYTSPHLERLEERFVIDGAQCSEAEFVQLAADVQAATMGLDPIDKSPTFFETTTAMGFLHFARSRADVMVLEVGLGGRLDSTNVCEPLVSVITSISFDHMKQLGNTLTEIAREKAGIIKRGVPVVTSVAGEEPWRVVKHVAAEQNARLIARGREFDFKLAPALEKLEPRMIYFEPAHPNEQPAYSIGALSLGMVGQHQALNAATAIATLRVLADRFAIEEHHLREGLREARCPGRIEVLNRNPTVIVDVAHNVASIEALVAALAQFNARRRILVFASSKDKDTAGMLARLLPHFDVAVLTRFINNPRAAEPEELLTLAKLASPASHAARCEGATDPASAFSRARAIAQPDDLICVTGSFFLAAEVRPLVFSDLKAN